MCGVFIIITMTRFFVKGGKVHKHPKGTKCMVDWNDEVLCEEPPMDEEKCAFCFDFQQ
jgi:hypothetical protein